MHSILYPMAAMALLTLVVLVINLIYRINAVRHKNINPRYFKTYQGEAPDHVVEASRNFSNLFEMPVLFYTAGVLAIALNVQTPVTVGLAWAYVVSRAVHSYIHIAHNHVYSRMGVFALSTAILVALWLVLVLAV
jgi:hypothetical protein